jgi:CubicO group peptidase (beta-lactamase class C family)
MSSAPIWRGWRDLVAYHHQLLRGSGIVGATLALVNKGEVVAADYFGLADLETQRPVDEHTIYHWASVTKTFTAVAIMQLRDQGLLDLDDPIVRYLPELREVHNPFGPMEAITIRQLLSHTAGFRDPTWPWGGSESWHPHEPAEWSQIVAMLPYTRIHFEPGSRYSYSNPGILFLGRALEAVSGDVYEAYIEKNLFRLLGLHRSYFDTTPWHLRKYRSNNYRIVEGQPVANGLDFNTGITVSNGGLNAPVGDMAKWLGFLMDAPAALRSRHELVLARPSLEEMWRPAVPVGDSPLGPEAMGLSFFLYEQAGQRLIGHTGDQKSFRAFILFDPIARVGLIGAYNTADGDSTAPDTDGILDAIRGCAARELFPLFQGVKASG